MTDIFAILDAAIEEIDQDRRSEFPFFPPSGEPRGGTGTPKVMKNNGVPDVPVVPAENNAIHDETKRTFANPTHGANDLGEIPPKDYTFNNTGSTGSAGTPQASRGSAAGIDPVWWTP
jgi:hypothetical protein